MNNKFISAVYLLGHQLYNYYLEKIGATAVEIQGKLGKTYMQYFIEIPSGRYAIRFIDCAHLSKEDIGKEVAAEVMDGLIAPEGYLGFCRKVSFVAQTQENA